VNAIEVLPAMLVPVMKVRACGSSPMGRRGIDVAVVMCGRRPQRGGEERWLAVSQVGEMLRTYPADLGKVDRDALARCIDECFSCAQACTACADACMSETDKAMPTLRKCIRSCVDCADTCEVTGRILSRHTGYDANLTRAMLEACATACRSTADECEQHAQRHEHCRVCAEACRRCEQACRQLLNALG
jgi:hypothetical protein